MGFLSVRSIAVSSAAQDQTGHPDHPEQRAQPRGHNQGAKVWLSEASAGGSGGSGPSGASAGPLGDRSHDSAGNGDLAC